MSEPMPEYEQQHSHIGLLILAGIGAGALTGALLGLAVARRPRMLAHSEITETVDDLKRRAEEILTELSRSAVVLKPSS